MRKSVPVLIKRSSTSDACDCDLNLAASRISYNCQPKMMKIGSHFETRQRLIRSNQRNKDRLFGDQASMYLPSCLTPHSIRALSQSFGSQLSILIKVMQEVMDLFNISLILNTCFHSIAQSKYESFPFFNWKNVLYYMHSRIIQILFIQKSNSYISCFSLINGPETSLSTKL